MEERIRLAMAELGMHSACQKVIIGFSGGADSSALLHYFKDKAHQVVCVHINHMIRGDEAQRDEEFCRRICQGYGVELVCHKIDIPSLARERGQGIEQTAREERYRVFNELLEARGFDAILTAHNANDNAESVIFNLVRGSGANGMSGIKGKNGKILRPLILATRAQILEYCEKNNIEFVNDSTNDSTEYTRNYLRHEIVPWLLKLNPSLDSAIYRLTASLRTDDDFILAEATRFIDAYCDGGKIPADKIASLHDSVRARVLKLLSGENLDYKAISHCIDFISRSECSEVINLCKGVSFKRERDYFIFIKTSALLSSEFEITLRAGVNYIEQIGVAIAYMTDSAPNGMEHCLTLYLKDISGPLVARSRKEGDTIRHGKMTKRVKRIFNDRKIPTHLRDKIPMLCDDKGIVAIPGVAVRDGAKGSEKDIALKFYAKQA